MTYPAAAITTPDFTNLALVDATTMDAKIATRFNALLTMMTFSTFTPSPALTAGTTNPTLGTGSVVTGRYMQMGKLVLGFIYIQFGTSGTNAGSGNYMITLPVTSATPSQVQSIGHGRITTAGTQKFAQLCLNATNTTFIRYEGGGTTNASNTSPGAWTANDLLFFNFQYEAA
jgi:hypothetical protein